MRIFTFLFLTVPLLTKLASGFPKSESQQIEKDNVKTKTLSAEELQAVNKMKAAIEKNLDGTETPLKLSLLNGVEFVFDEVQVFTTSDGNLHADFSPIKMMLADGKQKQISGDQFEQLEETTVTEITEFSGTVVLQLKDGSKIMTEPNYDAENNHLKVDLSPVLLIKGQSVDEAIEELGKAPTFVKMAPNGSLRQVESL